MDIRPGRDSPRAMQIKTVVERVTSGRVANELLVLIFARLTHMHDERTNDRRRWRRRRKTRRRRRTRASAAFRVSRQRRQRRGRRRRRRPWNVCRLKTPLKPVSKHTIVDATTAGFYLNSQVLALSECALGVVVRTANVSTRKDFLRSLVPALRWRNFL